MWISFTKLRSGLERPTEGLRDFSSSVDVLVYTQPREPLFTSPFSSVWTYFSEALRAVTWYSFHPCISLFTSHTNIGKYRNDFLYSFGLTHATEKLLNQIHWIKIKSVAEEIPHSLSALFRLRNVQIKETRTSHGDRRPEGLLVRQPETL